MAALTPIKTVEYTLTRTAVPATDLVDLHPQQIVLEDSTHQLILATPRSHVFMAFRNYVWIMASETNPGDVRVDKRTQPSVSNYNLQQDAFYALGKPVFCIRGWQAVEIDWPVRSQRPGTNNLWAYGFHISGYSTMVLTVTQVMGTRQ